MLNPHHLELLGPALKDLRGAAGRTQAEVCADAGLRSPQLSRWENGHEVPTLESLIKYLAAIGTGLMDLERVLLEAGERGRLAAIHEAVRAAHAEHQRCLNADVDLRSAVGRIARPNPEGLERPRLDLCEEVEPAGELSAGAAATGGSAADVVPSNVVPSDVAVALAPLIEGLPETLDELLDEPAYRQPATVRRLIDRGWTMLDACDTRGAHIGDAARLLAGELPEAFGRRWCFELRARGLELWGMALRAMGEPVTAEAALLCAFELLAQARNVEPADLAAILDRLAKAASGDDAAGDRRERGKRYAREAERILRASDGEVL